MVAIGISNISNATQAEAIEASSEKSRLHYLLFLTLNEFSILNVSEMDGLQKYGGSGDFQLKMAKEGSNVVWNVTVDNPRLMELLGIFVGERTMKLVQTIDPNNLDPNQKIALDAIKSLSQKLEFAQQHPVWDSLKLSGVVVQQGTNWLLQSKDDSFKLTGDKLDEIRSRNGKAVVADGFVKMPGEFEVTRFLDKRENTLELFVMSFCPFGQKAEAKLLAFLASTNATAKPRLDVHYIFYKQQIDGKEAFVSLHGKKEVMEDLVQMMMRDHFPSAVFENYLHLRNQSGDTDWKKLAAQAGLTPENLAMIESTIATHHEALIRGEYDYVESRYGTIDASPSYVWESERVSDLKKIAAFKGLDEITVETCSN